MKKIILFVVCCLCTLCVNAQNENKMDFTTIKVVNVHDECEVARVLTHIELGDSWISIETEGKELEVFNLGKFVETGSEDNIVKLNETRYGYQRTYAIDTTDMPSMALKDKPQSITYRVYVSPTSGAVLKEFIYVNYSNGDKVIYM